MARFDKYDPIDGGFRAALYADLAKTSAGNPIAVGLNSSGLIVAGPGQTGIVGLVCLTENKKANDVIDVMTDGEIVGLTGLTAGTIITAHTTDGVLGTNAPAATYRRVGFTVEATRLVVRTGPYNEKS